jgi:sulfite reductase beta subunit-like hemoprotein
MTALLDAAPSFADVDEIDRYADSVRAYLAGDLDPEEFRRTRLWHGVYGIRHLTDVQMIRLKLPGGLLTADALDAAADVAETWSRGWGHLTTRQNIQFHFVDVADTPDVLRRMAQAGVTTREACGDTVRNVTTCHLAGVCPLEVLDVNAAAEALARHFLRNPIAQNLPRKFKIAASGCAVDCALTGIHDIGVLATEVDGRKGFRLMVGGGLGTAPHEAKALEPLTDPADLIVTAEAILRVWDREMPRGKRAHTRMKFLVAKLGIEAFREKVLTEREALRCSADYRHQPPEDFLPPRRELAGPASPEARDHTPADPEAYAAWRETNVIEQSQPNRFAAYVTVPLGDLTTEQFRLLAKAARDLGVAYRVTVRQNLVVRDLRAGDIPLLHDLLSGPRRLPRCRGGDHGRPRRRGPRGRGSDHQRLRLPQLVRAAAVGRHRAVRPGPPGRDGRGARLPHSARWPHHRRRRPVRPLRRQGPGPPHARGGRRRGGPLRGGAHRQGALRRVGRPGRTRHHRRRPGHLRREASPRHRPGGLSRLGRDPAVPGDPRPR